MHFSPDQPFNQLPDLPPKAELETPRVLKTTTRASRALAELKGRTHSIPNPTILLNTLAVQEAKLILKSRIFSPPTTNSIAASPPTERPPTFPLMPKRSCITATPSGME